MREDGAHIRLARANEDLLAVALLTAWKLRVEKNAKAGRKKRAGRLLNSSEPACRPRAPGGSGFPAVPVSWQKNERQREHSAPFCFAAILLPGPQTSAFLYVSSARITDSAVMITKEIMYNDTGQDLLCAQASSAVDTGSAMPPAKIDAI